jgi:CheY-like chemotaxis protein/CBS domain-containing protein
MDVFSTWNEKSTRSRWNRQVAGQTRVVEIMNSCPLCLDPNMAVEEARELLLMHEVRIAPVVDENRRPIGVVTLRDLLGSAIENEQDEEAGDGCIRLYTRTYDGVRYPLELGFHLERLLGARVGDVMMHMVFQLPTDASIARATALMAFEEVSQLLIVEADGTLTGMVTSDDVTRWVARMAGLWPPRQAWVDEPATPIGAEDEWEEQAKTSPVLRAVEGARKVLVVEDDATICESLVEILEEEGYAGLKALNGRQALDALEHLPTRPGLILLDLMMPEMNGWEFRRAQLANQRWKDIPVVVLSAHTHGNADRELNHPAAFLRKPVAIDALKATVAQHYDARN